MIVLGSTNDDKGSQLEALTQRILEHRGFQNVVVNFISSGGEEIDVRGEYVVPGMLGQFATTMLSECKAYRSPVAMPAWLKFLGKIFAEEIRTGRQTAGTFVALSGVNGNVAGHYEAIRERRSDIALITGTDLRRTLEQVFGLCPLEEVDRYLQRSTARTVQRAEEVYYDERVYWFVTFADDDYTILSAGGGMVDNATAGRIQPLVANALDVGNYINLAAEVEARERREMIARVVVATLLQDVPLPGAADLAPHVPDASDGEIAAVVDLLLSQGWLVNEADGHGTPKIAVRRAREEIGAMYRFLLERRVPATTVALFGSQSHARHVRAFLAPEVLAFHDLLLEDDVRADVEKMLRWSPSALGWALRQHDFLLNSRPSPAWPEGQQHAVQRTRVQYFLREVLSRVRVDIGHPATSALFLRSHRVDGIETTMHVIIRGKDGEELNRTFAEKLRLGELEEGFVGPGGADVAPMVIIENTANRQSDHPDRSD